jgi:hypothetical protein
MIDLLYVAFIVFFFTAMIAFAFGCRALGRDALTDPEEL